MASVSAGTQQAPERAIVKIALASLAGSSIEWYDFFIYGTAAALVFPTLYFPEGLPTLVAQLAAFSTFAVGFIARPVGGIVFGHFGDRVGRKKALVVALVMMGLGTTLIGLLPSYAVLGVAAPVLLVVLRFVQGLAIGGQWGGVVLLVTESCPQDKRGFYGSFAQVGVPVGVLFANLLFLIITASVSPEALVTWAWRIPFLLSMLLVGLGIYIQFRLEDTPAFRHLEEVKEERDREAAEHRAQERDESMEEARAEIEAEKHERSPILEALIQHPKEVALAAGAFVATNGIFYIFIAFIIAYATNPDTIGMSESTVLTAVLISSVVQIPALLGFSAFSDRYGRRGIYMVGAATLGLWSLFAFWPLVDTGSFIAIAVALTIGQVFLSMMYGPQAAFYSEIFSTRIRYSGASLGYQLGAVLGGGLATVLASYLLILFGTPTAIGVYMALLCAISLLCTYLLTETYQADVDDVEDTVVPEGGGAATS